ncbi:MAG: type II secretion system protein [Candidatus Gracilibacteria bacterium]|nr:type II secretion system protein [Candidatus Gracilibacteria bacterium]
MNTQKIQASSNVKGFTLVELIVVITILVILGTIAFLNLGGMSASARDSKRKTDLSSIMSKITITQAGGASLTSLVTAVTAQQVTSVSIAGNSTPGTAYSAGTPNFTALGMNANEFKDPDGTNSYKMGVTTLAGGALQLAATLETDTSGGTTKNALVSGTFKARTIAAPDVSAAAAAGTAVSGSATDVNIAIGDADVGKFKTNDIILETGICATTATVIAVSSDLKTLTVRCTGAVTTGAYAAGVLKLKVAESNGLIADKTAAANPVVNLGTTYLPY